MGYAYPGEPASAELRAALIDGLDALRSVLMARREAGVSGTRPRGQGNDAATRHQPGPNSRAVTGRRPAPPGGSSRDGGRPPLAGPGDDLDLTGPGAAPPAAPDGPDATTATAHAVEAWRLVERAQAGDAAAFGLIYDRYLDTIFRFIYYRVGDRQLAEDLAADTFLRALRNIGSFTWQGRDPGAWLVTIARNRVADHYKSGRYRLEISTGDLLETDREARGPEGSPESAVVDHLTNVTLLNAVKQLNPEQQECIVLRFLQGFSVAETAQAMGKNEGAIKALQYRAVRTLARLLPDGFES
ncbi:MAG TPA: sigma-70 family RNA polymerase sigma factor [Micromonosporaceae bacterium]|nr:sigma-70 family RNA polymerase sigma factor [Micromonosporaceae bacterium]